MKNFPVFYRVLKFIGKSVIKLGTLQLVVSEQKLGPSVPRCGFAMLCCGSLKTWEKMLGSDFEVIVWMEFHLLCLKQENEIDW